MGLLDNLSDFAASDAGMGLAQGLLSANGSQGMAAGLAGMQRAKQMQLENEMKRQAMASQALQMQAAQLQLQNAQRDASRSERIDALAPQFNVSPERADALSQGPSSPDNPMQQVSPGFNWDGYANAVTAIDPKQGLAYRQALAKESPFNKMDVKDFTPESIAKFAVTKNHADLRARSKLHFANSGASIDGLDEYTGNRVSSLPVTGNQFSDLLIPDGNGGVTQNKPLMGAKIAIAQAGKPVNSTTVINAGPKAFETELGKLDAEQLGKWRDGASSAQNTLSIVENLRAAEQKGAYSGGAANAKLAVASLINGLTGVTPKGLVGSELFNSEANKLVLEKVKTLGANPSNADREFIERTVPRLATSVQARAEMANFMEQKANQSLMLYKAADAHARANSGLKGFDETQFSQQPKILAPSKQFKIDGGAAVIGQLGADGNYYVTRNGKKYKIEE